MSNGHHLIWSKNFDKKGQNFALYPVFLILIGVQYEIFRLINLRTAFLLFVNKLKIGNSENEHTANKNTNRFIIPINVTTHEMTQYYTKCTAL